MRYDISLFEAIEGERLDPAMMTPEQIRQFAAQNGFDIADADELIEENEK